MENSWKVVEHIRDGHEKDAWEAAQALAKAVLDKREVALAVAVLRGGPFAIRRALELAELVIDSETARGPAPSTAAPSDETGGRCPK
jgi:hypothetical protein